MQLWPGLHWRDQTETGDQTEGTSGHLRERYDGEIGCGRACVGEPPPHQLGGDFSAGQGWRSRGTTVEGGPSHPDDTCNRGSGLEIPGCWSALMRRKGGMVLTNLWPPLTYNDASSAVHDYKMLMFSHYLYSCPNDDWSIQLKHQLKLVSENYFLFMQEPTEKLQLWALPDASIYSYWPNGPRTDTFWLALSMLQNIAHGTVFSLGK